MTPTDCNSTKESMNDWIWLISVDILIGWLEFVFGLAAGKRSFNFSFSHSTFIHQFTPFSLHLTWFWHTLMTSTKFIFQHMEKTRPFVNSSILGPSQGHGRVQRSHRSHSYPWNGIKKNPWIGIENPWNRTENLWKGIRNPSTSPNISLHASESLKWDQKSLKWDKKIPELG